MLPLYNSIFFRPPLQKRLTIKAWIQHCPSCGYCNTVIDGQTSDMAQVYIRKNFMTSPQYQQQLKSSEYPALANYFLCYSLILENEEKFQEAYKQSQYAAWVCDDDKGQNYETGAKNCRLRTAELIDKVKQQQKQQHEPANHEEEDINLIHIDVLRRAEQFEQALNLIKQELNKNSSTNVLKFQQHLCETKDKKCYTMNDVKKSS
ncbi:unnamed protein product [Didymodactylos carnosus]|uniref:Uncharacterized protein n=1 Tax=Didymodactylos carnosus TaxID=1234261 RepID=A0A814MQ87_9BILA|nr:unnamed protein product [Didymodactylos carnosus]CAF1216890.1 unnamed protein product [Didymodactylos carnosus]CAF3848094.1 unnamed protein product [Didymodactylos carnosus]CAF4025269.1 unnamed protein product [Didymodactylos carnosus]